MTPITLLTALATGLLGVLIGAGLGRRNRPDPLDPIAPTLPLTNPDLERAREELTRVKALLHLGPAQRLVRRGSFGAARDSLGTIVSELFAQKQLRAAALVDEHALPFAHRGDASLVEQMSAWSGAASALGLFAHAGSLVEVEDQRGRHIVLERLPGLERSHPLFLATWSVGLPLASIHRARFAHFMGHEPLEFRAPP
ncbi:MAG: hypothetical protein AAGI01_18515, partial [Myxococcota bacterium]